MSKPQIGSIVANNCDNTLPVNCLNHDCFHFMKKCTPTVHSVEGGS